MVSSGELITEYVALKEDTEATTIHYAGHQQEASDGQALMGERQSGLESINSISEQLSHIADLADTLAGQFAGDADEAKNEQTIVEGNNEHVSEIATKAAHLSEGSSNSATDAMNGNLQAAQDAATQGLESIGTAEQRVRTAAEQAQGVATAIREAIGYIATLGTTVEEAIAAFGEAATKHGEVQDSLGAAAANIEEVVQNI
jgi:chromosome segregation ATPase